MQIPTGKPNKNKTKTSFLKLLLEIGCCKKLVAELWFFSYKINVQTAGRRQHYRHIFLAQCIHADVLL